MDKILKMKEDIHKYVTEKLNEGIECATVTIKNSKAERVVMRMIYLPNILAYRTINGDEIFTWIKLEDACEYFIENS